MSMIFNEPLARRNGKTTQQEAEIQKALESGTKVVIVKPFGLEIRFRVKHLTIHQFYPRRA